MVAFEIFQRPIRYVMQLSGIIKDFAFSVPSLSKHKKTLKLEHVRNDIYNQGKLL